MRVVLTLLFWMQCFGALAQSAFQPVPGLPTNEVYDLHVDRKGFLWIAHDLGITRYDGVNFLSYSCPTLSSLSMSDIVEDAMGRIWCHNFSGQVFYIEAGRMVQYRDFDENREAHYPRMALLGNELLITSNVGLYVCNTVTGKGHYLRSGTPGSDVVSIAVTSRFAVLLNNNRWFLYRPGSALIPLPVDPAIQLSRAGANILQPTTFQDTIYLVNNPEGRVQKLLLRNERLELAGSLEVGDFINTVTVLDQPLIHARNHTFTSGGAAVLSGQTLTDAVRDGEGNTWYSSLKNGLVVRHRPRPWSRVSIDLPPGDYVRCINNAAGYLLAGTQRGSLLLLSDSLKVLWKHSLFDGFGSITFIRYMGRDLFVVGATVHAYVVNARTRQIRMFLPFQSIKDVDYGPSSIFIATGNGVYSVPFPDSTLHPEGFAQRPASGQPSGTMGHPTIGGRARAVRYHASDSSLYVSLKTGLHRIGRQGVEKLRIEGVQPFVSSLWYRAPRMYIATFGNGLWIEESGKYRRITTQNGLKSNTILRIKATEEHLWLFEEQGMQVFDIERNQLLSALELPGVKGANVLDVAEDGDWGYMATAEELYRIPMRPGPTRVQAPTYLDYMVVNGRDTLAGQGMELKHYQNEVEFLFSTPAFGHPQSISFRYRLRGGGEQWQTLRPGERSLRFASLPPGSYTLEIYALYNGSGDERSAVRTSFTVLPPWWNQWWFIGLVILSVLLLGYLIYRYRVNQLLRVERMRHQISRDLHDDIGATLSSVNIYVELVRSETGPNEYLDLIEAYAAEAVTKLDDLVWSLNPLSDSGAQLIQRMKLYAEPLLAAARIRSYFDYDRRLLEQPIPADIKRNLYLIFKESINNVVKHSRANNCYVALVLHEGQLRVSIADDGIGYAEEEEEDNDGNGIRNIRSRVAEMKGSVQFEGEKAQGRVINITIPTK